MQMQRLLLALLPQRDRETVFGDLLEEFHEQQRIHRSRVRAEFWYARQVISFFPESRYTAMNLQRSTLTILCAFTALSGLWLGTMDLVLRHPGVAGREMIAGSLVAQGLLTLGLLYLRRMFLLRPLVLVGTLALLWLAVTAASATLHGSHLEGYVLLIAMALVAQALLTLRLFAPVKRPH